MIGQFCIDSLEPHMLISLLQLCDERRINVVGQNHCIQSFFLEHVDILALLLFIRYIVDGCLHILCNGVCILVLIFFILIRLYNRAAVLLNTFFECQIVVIQILEEDIVCHLLTELIIFQAAKLDERTDIIPVFFISFLISLAHSGQFVCHFLGNVFCDLLYKSIILQCTS